MFSPNFQIKNATAKNRAERPIIDAIINIKKLISNAPAEIVNILYGNGVKPAVKMIQKFHLSYNVFILSNAWTVKPGTLSKKNKAVLENSLTPSHQTKCPMANPNTAPNKEPIVQTNANRKALEIAPKIKAMRSASGGIGKKDDSINANMNNAYNPCGVSAQCSTQSYNLLTTFFCCTSSVKSSLTVYLHPYHVKLFI